MGIEDNVEARFDFEVTGGGIKDLEYLATLLGTVNEAAGTLLATSGMLSDGIAAQTKTVIAASKAYTAYNRKLQETAAAQATVAKGATVGAVTASPTTGSTSTSPVSNAAVRIEQISAARSLAIQEATAIKSQAIAQATADKKVAIVEQEAKLKRVIDSRASSTEVALARANGAQVLAARKAAIDKELALVIAQQNEIIAVKKAEATAEIALVNSASGTTAARIRAQEELAVETASATRRLAERAATEREITQITAAESTKRRAMLQAELAVSPDRLISGLSNTRYALYDVARTAGVAGVALGAMFVVPQAVSASYDKQMLSVIRTTGALDSEVAGLTDSFMELSMNMPTKFNELTNIGTIAGQLNVSADAVANFTENIAMFSATTNTSADEAATNIGRLAQLTGTSASEYNNLTAAIYQTGVTSVATEQEILNMGSEIATAGDLAGFTNVQIVALSSALSSLGVQPEAARGSLQRLFNIIQVGSDSSGKATKQLADIAGVTTAELQQLWNNGEQGSQEFFSKFVAGLGQMQNAGVNTTQVLKDLGVYQVRDQRLLQVLANNTEVYNQALEESASAYKDGTALSAAYAKQTDNLIDNWDTFTNSVGVLFAELGKSEALNSLLKILTSVVDVMVQFGKTPMGNALGTITILAAGLGAAFAGLVATMALVRAAQFGIITATTSLGSGFQIGAGSAVNLAKSVMATVVAMTRGELSTEEATRILSGYVTATNEATLANGRFTLASESMNATLARGAVPGLGGTVGMMGKLSGVAGKAIPALLGVSIAFGVIEMAMESLNNTKTGEDVFDSSTASSFADALKKDAEEIQNGAQKIGEFTTQVEVSNTTTPQWAKEIDENANAQGRLADAVSTTTTKVQDATVAIGENTKAAMINAIVNNEEFLKAWTEAGQAFADQPTFMEEYFSRVASDADRGAAWVQQKLSAAQAELDSMGLEGPARTWTQAEKDRQQVLLKQITVLKTLGSTTSGVGYQMGIAASKAKAMEAGVKVLGEDASDASSGVDTLSDSVSELTAKAKAPYAVANSWRDFGSSIAENGLVFEGLSASASKNVNAVIDLVGQMKTAAGDDTEAFAGNVAGVMAMLQGQGVNTGKSLNFLSEVLQSTFGQKYGLDFSTEAADKNIVGLINRLIQTQLAIIKTKYLAAQSGDPAAQQEYNNALAAYNALGKLGANMTKSLNSGQKQYNSSVKDGTSATKANTAATRKQVRTYADWADDLKSVIDRMDELRFGSKKTMAEVKKATQDAVRTMLDEMYNIEGAYDRVFNKRTRKDDILSIFYDVQDAAEDAADKVRSAANDILSAQADLAGINSDRSNLLYGLQVAIDYGDTLRAQAIRAKLAELAAEQAKAEKDLADAKKDLTDAQDSQNKSLTDNSKQAIENRKTVRDLLGTYTDYLDRLVDSGASAKDLKDAVKQSKADFLKQAEALGFSADELAKYGSLFDSYMASSGGVTQDATDSVDDLYQAWQEYILSLANSGASQKEINKAIQDAKTAVKKLADQMGLSKSAVKPYVDSFEGIKDIVAKIPKNVTVTFKSNSDAAKNAIAEFKAKLDGAAASSGKLNTSLGKLPKTVTSTVKVNFPNLEKELKILDLENQILSLKHQLSSAIKRGADNVAELLIKAIANKTKQLNSIKKNMWTGGYTGAGGKYEPANDVQVHRGEYIVPKSQVNQQTKKPYFMERAATAITAQAFPTSIMVELSPTDRDLLRASGATVEISLDGKQLASAVNKANRNSSVRGSR